MEMMHPVMPAHASQHAWMFATFCCAGATSDPVMPFPFWVAPQTCPDEAETLPRRSERSEIIQVGANF